MLKINVKFFKSKSIDTAIKLINTFKKKNNIDFRLNLLIDYDSEYRGYYYYCGNKLYVNTNNCSESALGYPEGDNVINIIMHEFGHFLDSKYKIEKSYLEHIEKYGNLYVTEYAKTELIEEIAEILMIYLINPFLLKKIDLTTFKFISNIMKSPTPCSESVLIKQWKEWNRFERMEFWKYYGIKVLKGSIIYKKNFNYNKFKERT